MQVLQPATSDVPRASPRACARASARGCAADLIELMPQVMYLLRSSYRRGKRPGTGISVPQVRVLALVQRRPEGSLSELADLLGISLPAASRLVDTMVRRKLIRRQISPQDRRHVALMLTPAGQRQLAAAREIGTAALGERLAGLSAGQQQAARQALQDLLRCFGEAPRS